MTNAGSADVSVVIPVYNRAHTLRRAVESALAQDGGIGEVVVVDDGSTDDPASALSGVVGSISIVRLELNRGAAAARNVGIEHARGRLVAFLDSDDWWHPEKTSRQLKFMREQQVDLACTEVARPIPGESGAAPLIRPFPPRLGLDTFIWGCHVSPGTTLLAKRDLLMEMGGYDESLLRLEDWDLLLRVALAGHPAGYLDEPLGIIVRGLSPPADRVMSSLSRLRTKHAPVVEALGESWARRFAAALDFERAVALWNAGRRLRAVLPLARSVARVPRGHLPLNLQMRRWRGR